MILSLENLEMIHVNDISQIPTKFIYACIFMCSDTPIEKKAQVQQL